MVIYGTVVIATCDRGFILADGNLSRSVECAEGNNSITWNDTIHNCQREFYSHLFIYSFMLFNSFSKAHKTTDKRNDIETCTQTENTERQTENKQEKSVLKIGKQRTEKTDANAVQEAYKRAA